MERRKEGREGPAGCRALPGCEEAMMSVYEEAGISGYEKAGKPGYEATRKPGNEEARASGDEETGTSGSILEGFQGTGYPDGVEGTEAAGKENHGRDGYRQVSAEQALQAIETGKPSGLFWCFAGGLYIAIDNTQQEVFCEDFLSWEECVRWLRCEWCVDAGGHVHFDW